MLKIICASALLFGGCGGVDDGDDDDSLLTIFNDSSFILEEVRVAGIGDPTFSGDLTGIDAVFPGESVTISLSCDDYDVLIVDEIGLECVILGIDVCDEARGFVVDDIMLDDCAFSASGSQEFQP